MSGTAALILAGVAAVAPGAAQDAVASRAASLIPLLNGGGDYLASFSPQFVKAVPEAKFRAIAASLSGQFGAATVIESISPKADRNEVVVGYAHGRVTLALTLDPAPPFRIGGLVVTAASAGEATLVEVVDAITGLPGSTGFALAELGGPKPRMIAGYQPDRPLAIGSAFKLVLLATLLDEVNKGARNWGDAVILDGRPLPGGAFTARPAGSRTTLEELAGAMIAVSDNSATDILLATLGRERVEAMQARIGIAEPWRNQPFLSTLEAFTLKGAQGGALGDQWAVADPASRRALLKGKVAAITPDKIAPDLFAHGPNRIGTVEWFASSADLVRAMDWLRRNSDGPRGAPARAILARNPGLPAGDAGRRYTGYKGGSEPGVMSMAFLVQGRSGRWFACSAGWNDAARPIDEGRFGTLVARALDLIPGQ